MDAFIDHLWLVEMSKNIDAFRYSSYLHKPRNGKITMGPCWDWNFVEDFDASRYSGSGSYGFIHQVRRVATTLFDAFDGHTTGTNAPGEGDFWSSAGSGYFFQAKTHSGDAHDEVIALPGSALRAFVHNWTHATWPLGWSPGWVSSMHWKLSVQTREAPCCSTTMVLLRCDRISSVVPRTPIVASPVVIL